MKNKYYYFAKACTFYGKTVRKLARRGYPVLDVAYQAFIKETIKKDYADIIAKYQNIDYKTTPQTDNYPIWIFWWQGLENMPEVVRICYNSVIENAGEHPVHLVTKENYRLYISELPDLDDILEHLRRGSLIYAHFSDIVRCYLLYVYGGAWVDATILLTDKIDNIVSNRVFVSGRRQLTEQNKKSITKGRWTTYFIFANKGNLLFKFIDEVLIRQIVWKGYIMDYFMLDFCFAIAYECVPFVKRIQEESPIYQNRIFDLLRHLNQEFNEAWYKSLIKTNPFLKLTYKRTWIEETKDHELTYYGWLKKRYL